MKKNPMNLMSKMILGFSMLLTAQNALATRSDLAQTATNTGPTSSTQSLPQSLNAPSNWRTNLTITVTPPFIDSGSFYSATPPGRARPSQGPRGSHYLGVRVNPENETPKRKNVTITPHGSMWIHSPSHGNTPYPNHRRPVRNEDARIEAHVTRQNSS